jgi:hypothetical protein
MSRITAVIPILVVVLPVNAVGSDPDARISAVAPFLDEQTVAVLHVDLSRVNSENLVDEAARLGLIPTDAVKEAKESAGRLLQTFTRAGGKDFYFIISLADLPAPAFLVVPLAPGADVQALTALINKLEVVPPGPRARLGRVLFAGSKATFERLKTLKPVPCPELAPALAAAGDSIAQGVLLPPPHAHRAVEELLPVLPPQLGGGPSAPLVRGVKWAAVGVELPPRLSVKLVIQSPDHPAAAALKERLTDLLKALGKLKEVRDVLPDFDKLAALVTPEVEQDRLSISMDGRKAAPILAALVARAREQAKRAQEMNNLRQILLAMHNYDSLNNSFPAAANFDRNGKPLLSWRVHLLPFLNQQDLYKQFHLDEPWDSDHNKKLIERMPAVYRSQLSQAPAGRTTYLAPVGKAMLFTGEAKGIAISNVTDGTSQTILLVDADDEHAVIWTRPDDLKIDASKPSAGLRCCEGRYLVGFVDGSVHRISATVGPKTLHALFTRNGGEVMPSDALK